MTVANPMMTGASFRERSNETLYLSGTPYLKVSKYGLNFSLRILAASPFLYFHFGIKERASYQL